MVEEIADNAPRSYRCNRCGHIFAIKAGSDNTCPVCGFNCDLHFCKILEASDEGY